MCHDQSSEVAGGDGVFEGMDRFWERACGSDIPLFESTYAGRICFDEELFFIISLSLSLSLSSKRSWRTTLKLASDSAVREKVKGFLTSGMERLILRCLTSPVAVKPL